MVKELKHKSVSLDSIPPISREGSSEYAKEVTNFMESPDKVWSYDSEKFKAKATTIAGGFRRASNKLGFGSAIEVKKRANVIYIVKK